MKTNLSVELYPIKTRIISSKDNFIEILLDSIPIKPMDKDVIIISSKPILISLNKIIKLSDVKVSQEAFEIARKYDLDPRFAELVLEYSDKIYGGVENTILTEKDGVMIANAGLDRKNSGIDLISESPTCLRGYAKEIYNSVLKRFGVRVGVIIRDSVVFPLRRGTRSIAIDTYGFETIIDYRGKRDLFGRVVQVTQLALADELSSAAHILMGECDESIPAVLIRGLDIKLSEEEYTELLTIPEDECIYKDLYRCFK